MPGAEELLMPAMPGIGGGAGGGVGIVGFGKAVHVFTSKQQPKSLTIYRSDFRSHDWYAGSHRVSWDSYQNLCICSNIVDVDINTVSSTDKSVPTVQGARGWGGGAAHGPARGAGVHLILNLWRHTRFSMQNTSVSSHV